MFIYFCVYVTTIKEEVAMNLGEGIREVQEEGEGNKSIEGKRGT